MTKLTFIIGQQGSGKTVIAKALAKHYQAGGVNAAVASEAGFGDWNKASDVQLMRETSFAHLFVDCFDELPFPSAIQAGDKVISIREVP
jgi:predicted ATPase